MCWQVPELEDLPGEDGRPGEETPEASGPGEEEEEEEEEAAEEAVEEAAEALGGGDGDLVPHDSSSIPHFMLLADPYFGSLEALLEVTVTLL